MSKLERLCIASYLRHFNCVNIFTYAPNLFTQYKETKLNIFNANDIIDSSDKFYYNGKGDCPVGSIVGFSDLFRYMLLSQVGGWYVDFDTVCLKPFDFKEDTVIRKHYKYDAISNICKFQKNDKILNELYAETRAAISESNTDWCLPLRIFRDVIYRHDYNRYVLAGVFNDDSINDHILPFIQKSIVSIDVTKLYAIHWCRSALTTGSWSSSHYCDINNPIPGTYLALLYRMYDIK